MGRCRPARSGSCRRPSGPGGCAPPSPARDVGGCGVAGAGHSAGLAWRSQQSFRPQVALVLPLCFVGIAAVQSLPLPAGLRARLDPVGFDLAAGENAGRAMPMSLDPPETRKELATAGAAAAVALAALVLSAGRRLRLAAPVLVAVAGLVTLAVGLGHRVAFEEQDLRDLRHLQRSSGRAVHQPQP
jgi:hypothetical protein